MSNLKGNVPLPLCLSFFFFGRDVWQMGSYFLDPGWSRGPMQCRPGVLITGPPGKPRLCLLNSTR